jgi:hypothetical protein
MGYDLFVRSCRTHAKHARIADIAAILQACGLKRQSATQWLLDHDDRWMEVYLATVTEGPAGGDVISSNGVTFNELQCHPRPFNALSLSIVMRLAEHLDWSVHDPQFGRELHDANLNIRSPVFNEVGGRPGRRFRTHKGPTRDGAGRRRDG